MSDQQNQGEQLPFLIVVKLHEGYVLNVQGYGIAITNADDLARRVGEVAAQSETGFQSPAPEHDISDTIQVRQGPPPEAPQTTPQETARVLQAAPQEGPANLEVEWENVRRMIGFMAAGFDAKGQAFTRKEWDRLLPYAAPHVSQAEAEYELSEFLAELHDDE